MNELDKLVNEFNELKKREQGLTNDDEVSSFLGEFSDFTSRVRTAVKSAKGAGQDFLDTVEEWFNSLSGHFA